SFLALAGLRLEDPGTGADLRAALLDAIGAAAPVGLAIESLVPHLDPQSLGALEQVATRRGGVEALLEAYDARLVAGGDAMERRWIVGALDGEEHTTTLFDVARSDPDRGVRGQALVTLTLGLRAPNSATLDAILLGRDQSEDPFFGLATTDSITALSNLALRAGRSDQEDLHERSLTELVDMASNPNWPARERRLARRHLEHHLTPEELAEIDAR
ncbi:MAG: hypothetical protein O2816_17370, partial [Planctomycetota bacterium]|nr:hypothetical protein [Planctomycetota bacterium]